MSTPYPPPTPPVQREVPVTREHFEKACAFVNQSTHARVTLSTCGCLMNFALRDAFPEVPVVPDESATIYGDIDSSVVHACGAYSWTLSPPSANSNSNSNSNWTQWNFSDETAGLIQAFDRYISNPTGNPFPVDRLPYTATLTLAER